MKTLNETIEKLDKRIRTDEMNGDYLSAMEVNHEIYNAVWGALLKTVGTVRRIRAHLYSTDRERELEKIAMKKIIPVYLDILDSRAEQGSEFAWRFQYPDDNSQDLEEEAA